MADYQCTWWPDTWFGVSLTEYCIKHDLGGSDAGLFLDVASNGGVFIILGAVMFIGLKVGGPFYRAWKRINPQIKTENSMDLHLGYTQLIIESAKKHGLLRNQLAYVLATAYWETAHTMKPVKEAFWVKNAEAWRKKNLRYYPWYGRGFVQITWENNYKRASEKLGVDFIAKPDDVMKPKNSAEILVLGSKEGWFTGKKLSDYITLKRSDYRGARRIINGTDKAMAIAEIAKDYDADLRSIGYGETSTPPAYEPEQEVLDDADKPMAESTSFWTTLIGYATSLLAALNGLETPVAIAVIVVATGVAGYLIRERMRKAKLARAAKAEVLA